MTEHQFPSFPVGAQVLLGTVTQQNVEAAEPVIATCSSFYGILRPGGTRVSFDAALARVDPAQSAIARQLIPAPLGPVPGQFARFRSEIEDLKFYAMRSARGVRKNVQWHRYWGTNEAPPIVYDGLGTVLLRVPLVEYELTSDTTQPGDSGSAVVSSDDAILVGMHIAGQGNFGFMIPSFELLRPDNYVGMASGPFFSLVTS
jgi:hypothetical protein